MIRKEKENKWLSAEEKSKRRLRLISFVIAFFIIAAAVAWFLYEDGYFSEGKNGIFLSRPAEGSAEFHFIDVGQGDATLIRTNSGDILIDAGPNGAEQALRDYLDSYGIKEFEMCIFTHPDEDHIGGADMIIKEYGVKTVLMPEAESETTTFSSLLDAIEEKGVNVLNAVQNQEYNVGELSLFILSPDGTKQIIKNNYSIVLKAQIGSISVMLQGDAEAAAEEKIVKAYPADFLCCDIMKLGHHGSSSSSSDTWLAAVRPRIAIISCGKGNSYGHPNAETLNRLRKYGTDVYRTDKLGSIVFSTDGKDICYAKSTG